jgi:hypothetical protein
MIYNVQSFRKSNTPAARSRGKQQKKIINIIVASNEGSTPELRKKVRYNHGCQSHRRSS